MSCSVTIDVFDPLICYPLSVPHYLKILIVFKMLIVPNVIIVSLFCRSLMQYVGVSMLVSRFVW